MPLPKSFGIARGWPLGGGITPDKGGGVPAGYFALTNKNGSLRLTNKDGAVLLLGKAA